MTPVQTDTRSNPESVQDGPVRRIVDKAVLGFFGAMASINALLVGVGVELEANEYAETQSLPSIEDIETIGMAAGATIIFAGLSVLQYKNMQRRRQNPTE